MLRRFHLALVMSISAAALCGCGGAEHTQPPTGAATGADAAATKDKRHRFEAAKAGCMKQRGFKYLPYIKSTEPENDEQRKRESGDYQAMKKYREKYGFGIFARFVYPNELDGPTSTKKNPDPNDPIQDSLSGAQLHAYDEALDGCVVMAGKDVLGLALKSNIDYFDQLAVARTRAKTTELDGDSRLVELAASMATCLKSKGHKVGDTKPTAMEVRGDSEFLHLQDRVGREQESDAPTEQTSDDPNQIVLPALTPQDAKPYLAEEIKAALDDLECGKDFYAAYIPEDTTIKRRINDRFAF